jgi:hypothetical protein
MLTTELPMSWPTAPMAANKPIEDGVKPSSLARGGTVLCTM